MNWLTKILTALQKVLPAVGSVVDAAVPIAVGQRTELSVVAATLAPVMSQAACAVYPAACPIVNGVGMIAAALAPVFAGASVVRAKSTV
jgi:hypothetical protein